MTEKFAILQTLMLSVFTLHNLTAVPHTSFPLIFGNHIIVELSQATQLTDNNLPVIFSLAYENSTFAQGLSQSHNIRSSGS